MTPSERYHYRKDNGLCVRCGTIKEENHPYGIFCHRCFNLNQNYIREHGEENRNKLKSDPIRFKRHQERMHKNYLNKKMKRLEERLCQCCGEPLPFEYNKKTCENCLSNRQKEYNWLKDRNICINCHQNKVYEGMICCEDCLNKRAERSLRRYHNDRMLSGGGDSIDKQNYRKTLYRIIQDFRREHNLCRKCGKTLPDKNFRSCISCRMKASKSERKNRGTNSLDKRRQLGLCLYCEKPVKIGNNREGKPFKLCAECLLQHYGIDK